jgi:hypothetical protein
VNPGDRRNDELVEAPANVTLPTGHRGDVGLHRAVAIRFRNLRVTPRKQDWLRRMGGGLGDGG